jgi:hypothetical protein
MALATNTGEGGESLTATIAGEVAAATGMDETEFVLYEYIDPGALERLFRQQRAQNGADWTIAFSVEGADVVVSSDGDVSIES